MPDSYRDDYNGEPNEGFPTDVPFPQQIGGGGDEEDFDRPLEGGMGEDDATPQEPDVHEQLADMQAKMEEQQRRFEQQQQFLMSQLSNQQAGQPAAQPGQHEDQGFSFDDLPDPVEKPEEFRTELSKKMTENMQRERDRMMQQVTQQSQSTQQVDRLWNRFKERYPDLAEREALVNGVTNMEVQRMRASGANNVESVILADPDGFMDRIAGRMKQELGIESEGGSREGSGGQNGRRNGQGGRTKGVSSGTRQRVRSGGGEPPRSFIDQLKKSQLDNGLL